MRPSSARLFGFAWLLAIGSGAALACASAPRKAPRPPATLSGTISYRERIALPPSARVEVQLVDATDEDVPSPVVAERLMDEPGQVPIAFSLEYDAGAIQSSHAYALRIRIRVGEDIWFANPFDLRVLTGGNPSQVEVQLDRVSAGGAVAPPVSSRPAEPDPPDLDPRVRAARDEARQIDARLDRLDMREVSEAPERAGSEPRRLQLWVKDDRPVKLLVLEPDTPGRTTGVAYYFRDGQLFWARAPYAGFLFDGDALVLSVDDHLRPVSSQPADELARRAAHVRDDVRTHLESFGID